MASYLTRKRGLLPRREKPGDFMVAAIGAHFNALGANADQMAVATGGAVFGGFLGHCELPNRESVRNH